ncbi:dihydrodipicolinate synthase family protein [Shewanella litoralis]|uniref:dihydrodipicolinate synthase family protein n=1 Tax=Shewanella litoralis TaxID=2282700 RepID=UPI00135C08A0
MPIPRGIYPVIHTPLQPDQSLDMVSFEACLSRYLKKNIAGVTLLGCGGELPYFSDNEQYQLVKAAHTR